MVYKRTLGSIDSFVLDSISIEQRNGKCHL